MAWIQQAVTGKTDLWPILGAGYGRVDIVHTAIDMRERLIKRKRENEEREKEREREEERRRDVERQREEKCEDKLNEKERERDEEERERDEEERERERERERENNIPPREREIEMLNCLIHSICSLPDDTTLRPLSLSDTIRRIRSSAPHDWTYEEREREREREKTEESDSEREREEKEEREREREREEKEERERESIEPVFEASVRGMKVINEAERVWKSYSKSLK